jgi:hypothetical protein
MSGELEFDCGVIVKNIGATGLAIKKHIEDCKNAACIEDCKKQLPKYENVIL